MAYIGNTPAEAFSAFQKQDFTTSATTSYTLDHPVANQNEIALFINFVRQEPTAAYTASGTSLTLTSATTSSDDMYCVYLGKAVQTVNPPSGSVGSSQVAASVITGQTAEATVATDDTILIHDTSASALRKMTRANFVSGIGGTNTPSFLAYASTNQTLSTATSTRVALDTEVFDASNVFTNTSGNYKFTVPSGEAGKYLFYFQIRKNNLSGSRFRAEVIRTRSSAESAVLAAEEGGSGDSYATAGSVSIIDVQVADTYHVTAYHNDSGDRQLLGNIYSTFFGAYKIIE